MKTQRIVGQRPPARRLLVVMLAAILVSSAGCERKGKLTFALPTSDWWTAAPFILKESESFYKDQGIELDIADVSSGLASKNAVLAGTADLGLAAATPLALAAAREEKLVILGTYLRSSAVVGLVRRADAPPGQVPPEPVAVVKSTISESFLYAYLARKGNQGVVETKQLRELATRPADVPAVLSSGSAKSAVVWEPFLSLAGKREGFVVERSDDFEVNLYLLARPSVVRDHPDDVAKFLAAVTRACGYLRDHSPQAQRQLEDHFRFPDHFLAEVWPLVHYEVVDDRARMTKEILREAQTARKLGYLDRDLISVDYLFRTGDSR